MMAHKIPQTNQKIAALLIFEETCCTNTLNVGKVWDVMVDIVVEQYRNFADMYLCLDLGPVAALEVF